MGRNRVAKRVAKREVTAERPVFRREDDWRPVLDKMIVQRVGVIAAEPDSDALAQPVRSLQIGQAGANGERDRPGVEHDGAGGAVRGGLQPDDLGVERPCCVEIFGLNADEIGSDQVGHGWAFLRGVKSVVSVS